MAQTYRTEELYWFAGLFEGEGSSLSPKPGQFRLSIDSTDLDVLERVERGFGGRIYGPYLRGNNKPIYNWVFSGAKAAALAMTMYSLLATRRRANLVKHLNGWKLKNSYDVVHGTAAGYQKERSRKWPICDPCKKAHSKKCSENYKKRVGV